MKKLISGLIITLLISACSSEKENYLVKFHEGEADQMGVASGYINSEGDTIIPTGKYSYCYTDTIRTVGMVMEKESGKILGIDNNGTELFEVFNYDNGPDYVESGLFRIVNNGKIGYANSDGKIMIKPDFDCAYPFEGNFAKVSNNCVSEKMGDHSMWKSDNWYKITKDGKRVE